MVYKKTVKLVLFFAAEAKLRLMFKRKTNERHANRKANIRESEAQCDFKYMDKRELKYSRYK